jgi:hypothetical protein
MVKYILVILSIVAVIGIAKGTNDVIQVSAPVVADNVKNIENNITPTPIGSRAWVAIAAPTTSADRLTHATVYDPVGDKIYMIGGCPAGAAGTQMTNCQQYDPAANTWTDKAPMTTARGWVHGDYVRGKIYVIGGLSNSGTALSTNEEYTISSNTWATKAAIPIARLATLEVVWRDSLIYVMGGWDGVASGGMTDVSIYNPFTNAWTTGTALPMNGDMGSAVIIGDTIYITNAVNRSSSACWTSIYKGAINPANPTVITWAAGPVPPQLTSITASAAIGNDIYWMGGFVNLATGSSTCWKLNRATGVISTVDAYPYTIARNNFMVSRPGSYELYAMAGDANCNWSTPNNYYYKIAFPPPMPNDVGVDRIIAPGGSQQINVGIAPVCRVMNFGTAVQTSVPVRCSIIPPSGAVYYQTATITTINPGDTVRVTFPTWTPTVAGNYTVIMKTALTGDAYPNNDRMQSTCNVGSWILQEGFNGTFPPTGWQNIALNGTYVWQQTNAGVYPTCSPYEGAYMATYPSFSATSGMQARLISPPIALGINITPCTLKFFMVHDPGYSSSADQVTVETSTDGTNFTAVATFNRYAATQAWVEHDVYLGSISGTIYFSFLATSQWGNNMFIDFATLVGSGTPPGQKDVGMYAIRAPGLGVTINVPYTPIGVVKNFGLAPQTFAVVCSITGGGTTRYTNTQNVTSLASGETTRVNFATFTPTVSEIESVIMRTTLANDTQPNNNRMSRVCAVYSYYQDFEANDGGFIADPASGAWTWGTPTAGPGGAYSGVKCWGTGTYIASADWKLNSRQYTATVNNPQIGFMHWYAMEATYDGGNVKYSTDGTNWTVLTPTVDPYNGIGYSSSAIAGEPCWSGTTTGNFWHPAAFVVPVNSGQSFWIRWHLGCDPSVQYAGWYVDDVIGAGLSTGIEEQNLNSITLTALNAPKPNPVTNGLAHISFSIAEPTKASLKIYDASGRLIRTLMNSKLNVGNYNLNWNGTDDHNNNVAEGIYFYTLTTDNNNYTKKLVFTR